MAAAATRGRRRTTCLRLAALAGVAACARPGWAAPIRSPSTSWCAATVSGLPTRQITYYSQLFATPADATRLDAQYKDFVTARYAASPGLHVDSQCEQQGLASNAANVRKVNEAADARLSTIQEVLWPR